MESLNDQILEEVKQAIHTADLSLSDIPNIDLYMDQVITIFEDKMSGNKRREDDKLLTKTMINNYSKAGILRPVKGKKYSKEHILQMLLIYNLKQTLSLSDIEKITRGLEREQTDNFTEKLSSIYEDFLVRKQEQKDEFIRQFSESLSRGKELKSLEDLYGVILSLCSMSNLLRLSAEKLIDDHFDDLKTEK